jgi:hypothetical protein
MHPETDEIQMREDEGVRSYSVVSVYRDGAMCDICLQNVLDTAELASTELYDDGASRRDTLNVCSGCAYRVGALFAPYNAGKELFCGVLQSSV